MGQPRLSGLALMHIHREKNMNVGRVIDIFVPKHRALEFVDILLPIYIYEDVHYVIQKSVN